MRLPRQYGVLLFVSNLFFLLLFLSLSFYNRLAADDFHFLANVKQFGILHGTLAEYNTWSTRWASVLLNHSFIWLSQYTSCALFLFGFLSLASMITAVFFLLKSLQRLWFTEQVVSVWLLLNISIYVVSTLFLSTVKIDETWFWLSASCTYLWSIIMFVIGMAWLLNPRRNILLTIVGILAFAYIGGSCDPFALFDLVLLLTLLVMVWFDLVSINIPKKWLVSRLLWALLFCLAAFILLYSGPGIKNRESFFQETGIFTSLLLNFKFSGIIFIKRLPDILPLTLLLCSPALYWGWSKRNEAHDMKWKREIAWLMIGYISVIYLYQLPITYVTHDVGAYRALFPITLFTIILFIRLFYLTGKNFLKNERSLKTVVFIALFISCLINGYHLFHQYGIVRYYAEAYDSRLERVKQNANHISPFEVEPLPPSGMLYPAELSTDTAFFTNQHFKSGLGLSFSVKTK